MRTTTPWTKPLTPLFRRFPVCVLWLTLITQGCAENQPPCTFDSECRAGARCVQGSCYTECLSDEECTQSKAASCLTVERGRDTSQQLSVCASPELTNQMVDVSAMRCEEDALCQDLFRDERARCSLLSTCIIPPEEHALLVTAKTGAREVALVSAYMEDEAGDYLGALNLVQYQPSDPMESADPPMNWNHEPPLTCTPELPLESLSLQSTAGGGFARLGLVTTEGRILFKEGWRVVLVELTDVCENEDSNIDVNVDISLCVSLAGDPFLPEEHCARPLTVERRKEPLSTGSEAVVTFTQ